MGMSRGLVVRWFSFLAVLLLAAQARATFHLMQIEQVMGGVNGDPTAQAIQLRMRAVGQNLVSGARLIAYDAQGLNPVLLVDMTTNVTNRALGTRVLVASASFVTLTNPTTVPDFTMTNLIPESYLAAGRLTFESDLGEVIWSLSWGGSSYTGPTTGSILNDDNGTYGPAFGSALPSGSLQALKFNGSASAKSTTNAADYSVTAGAAVFTNNAGTSFTVTGGGTPLTLTADGTCPAGGAIQVSWTGATPGGTIDLYFAKNLGSQTVPSGPCAGTALSLGATAFQKPFSGGAGANGNRTVNSNAASSACGGFLQLVDLATCRTSNTALIQ